MAKNKHTGRNYGNQSNIEKLLGDIYSALNNINGQNNSGDGGSGKTISSEWLTGKTPEQLQEEQKETALRETLSEANVAISAVTNIVKSWSLFYINMTQKTMNAASEIMKSEFQNIGAGVNKSFGNALGVFTKNANELSYSAAENMEEQFKSLQKFKIQKSLIQQRQYVDYRTEKNKLLLDSAVSGVEGVKGLFGIFKGINKYNKIGKKSNNKTKTGIKKFFSNTSLLNRFTAFTDAIATAGKTIGSAVIEVKNANLNLALEQRKLYGEMIEQHMEFISSQFKAVSQMSNENEKNIEKIDKSSSDIVRTFGYTGNQIYLVKNRLYKTNDAMSELGKSIEEYAQIQNSYIATSNRTVSLTDKEALAISANGINFGISDSESAAMVAGMNIFNQTIENSVDQFDEMRKLANKVGIASNKFAKDLSKNLDLAQKYNFKGGVDNMMKMSIWADKVRLNMNSLGSSIDGMIDGGIEGALKKASELQVLGGNTGIFSDPLAMSYEALQDPESYARRIESMTRDMGTFNSKTGETEFNSFEELKLRQMGKTLGISAVELKNMIREGRKGDRINPMLKGKGFSDEEMMGISSKALYDKKTGKWMVNDIHGNSMDVNNINRNNLKDILPIEQEEQALTYAKETMDIAQKQLAVQKMSAAMLAEMTHEEVYIEMLKRMEENENFVNENIDSLTNEAIETAKFNTKSLKGQNEQAVNAMDIGLTSKYRGKILESFENIAESQQGLLKSLDGNMLEAISGNTTALNNLTMQYISQTGNNDLINIANEQRAKILGNEQYSKISGGDNVTKEVQVNDGLIVHTDPQDSIMAAKPGGPFDKIFDGMLKKMDKLDEAVKVKNNMNIDISGKIELSSGGKSVDITPELSRNIVKVVVDQINRNNNGGKGELFPHRYAGVDK